MKFRVTAEPVTSHTTQKYRRRDHAPRQTQTKHPRSSHQRRPMFKPHHGAHPASHPVCALLRQRRTYSDSRDHPPSRAVYPIYSVAGRRRPGPLRRRARLRRRQRPRARLLQQREEEKSARRASQRRRQLRLSGELVPSARLARAARQQWAQRQRIRRLLLPRRQEG